MRERLQDLRGQIRFEARIQNHDNDVSKVKKDMLVFSELDLAFLKGKSISIQTFFP